MINPVINVSDGHHRPLLQVAVWLAALAVGGCGPGSGSGDGRSGEAYPSRAIEIVSWATPGGPSDLLAGALAEISSSSYPRFDVNPNTGEPLGRHTHMISADNTIYHDAARPSRIVLPLVSSASR